MNIPERIRHSWRPAAFALGLVFLADNSAATLPGSLPEPLQKKVSFAEVSAIFEKHCYECHGAETHRADFRLDDGQTALHGGSHGPNIIPGKSAESRLVQLVAGVNPEEVMPKEGERLSEVQIATLRAWIDQGAVWPGLDKAKPVEKWWSLKPVVKSEVPKVPGNTSSNPLDAFILAKLESKGLKPSPEADRATLIRRLYFDLLGLPPAPSDVAAFVADKNPQAYEALVDRLLASPQYGERWARHWLDVVHYGDTHGYDKDQPRPNAWPYRDYVIRSFNAGKPYSQFIQEQIAGDVLFPGSPDGIEALGFISAGPWDLIGHAEVPESKTDGKIARHLDRDDMISNTILTFNSLTINCAQCHNHKFDPISIDDYYNLQSVFAAVDRTTREYYSEPELNLKLAALKKGERELDEQFQAMQREINQAGGDAYRDLVKKIEAATSSGSAGKPEFGYHSAIAAKADEAKWVQVDLGKSTALNRIVLAPTSDDFAGIGDGFGFPRRFKIEVSNEPDFGSGVQVIHDGTAQDLPNPGIQPQVFSANGAEGRYVRVTATRLAPRQGDFILALAELEVFDAQGTNLALSTEVTALDSTEAPIRWARKNLVDGIYPAANRPPTDVASLRASLQQLFETKVPAETRKEWYQVTNRLAEVKTELGAMPEPKRAFVGAVHYGSGAFRGTGPDGGKPRVVHVLARGDVRSPMREAVPGALSAIDALPARFDLPENHTEGDRRKALALWLSDKRNPLTWRSIVNRVWQYHFGKGLVETPNDFGRMGALPSHPELLEWLAAEFRDGSQSFKSLHKLIVTSRAYRQISSVTPETEAAALADGENTYLWRMNRRKLEAEAVRDAMLLLSGKMDLHMFGPAFQDFIVEKPEHSPHYQYHLHDPDDPRTHRRTVYRFIVRSQPQPFMATLDCADPSMLVEKRNESLSALQALALMNNGFVVTMARHFAERVSEDHTTLEDQVRKAFSLALSRPPAPDELRQLTAFAREHGMPNACRLLFNLTEFSFVD